MSIHYVGGGCFAFSDMTDGGGSIDDDSYMYMKPKPKTQEEIEHMREEQLKMNNRLLIKACTHTQNTSDGMQVYHLLTHVMDIHSIKELKQLSIDDIFNYLSKVDDDVRDKMLKAILKIREY